eukprot:1181210-Prorocentrum_minimum.AAC.2
MHLRACRKVLSDRHSQRHPPRRRIYRGPIGGGTRGHTRGGDQSEEGREDIPGAVTNRRYARRTLTAALVRIAIAILRWGVRIFDAPLPLSAQEAESKSSSE